MALGGVQAQYLAVVMAAVVLAGSAFLMTLTRDRDPRHVPYVTMESKPHGKTGWRGPDRDS